MFQSGIFVLYLRNTFNSHRKKRADISTDRSTNQPTNKPTDQPANQPTNQTDRPTNRLNDQPEKLANICLSSKGGN